ncbi:AAA family ATPase [Paenibacillus sp. GCM10012306]|uniref:AAA family ATPase n=1 Tax=Paenibacillus sp. GCM10012306 TaxID=3317342 RepID=UPI00360F54E7
MIKGIHIKNVATYNHTGVVYDELKKVNFFYGSNGSGKTTLSNVLKNAESFPNSVIEWTSQPLKTLVYNQKFVEENFHQDSDIKGIFTLGKESADIKQSILRKKNLIDKVDEEIRRLTANLIIKQSDYEMNEAEFTEDCWKLKRKYDDVFSAAFTGLRNNKNNFAKKCKQVQAVDPICDLIDLKERANKLFRGSIEKLPLIDTIKIDSLHSICNHQIFRDQIIGKQEVDIAALIFKLSISDWVKQGHQHIDATNGICPFCQQELPESFIQKLNDYFNENYEKQMLELHDCIETYIRLIDKLESQLLELMTKHGNSYMELSVIRQQYELIQSKKEHNLDLIKQKQSQPSKSIEPSSYESFVNVVNTEIDRVNKEVMKHNDFVENRVNEEKLLIKQIWEYIFNVNQQNHEKYIRKEFSSGSAIARLTSTLELKKAEKNTLILEVEGLEAQITSVIPSVNDMNRLLKAYHFTNFKFAHTQNQGNYRLIRSNGQDVNQTLSEGEKTFVTFLYFMHLLNGSNNRERITENKVVIIDDPISSLDSNVLFIVSNLILKLINEVRSNLNNVTQLFILTHNIYFHKEITFNKKRSKGRRMQDETFWIIRKINDVTETKTYEINPIKSSYELMWQELRLAQDSSSMTVQNIIRRIIENYFKLFGNYSEDDILNKFDEEEKVICKSLLSWANDGSHFAGDDMYIEHPMDTVNKYLRIFEKIFVVTNHHSHYKMMMGIDESIEEGLDQTQIS